MADTKVSDFNLKISTDVAGSDLVPFLDVSQTGSDKNSVITYTELTAALKTLGALVSTNDSGVVTNAMLAGSIAYSKLVLTGAIVDGDLAGSISASKISGTAAVLTGNTFTGLIQFSGTTHGGIRLNNLTTTQRDAISSPTAGQLIWNTTTSRANIYDGAAWSTGWARLAGDTFTGAVIIAPSSAATALTLTGGTVTTSNPLISGTQTWNAAGVAFHAIDINVTDTAKNSSSTLFRLRRSASNSDAFAINVIEPYTMINFGGSSSSTAFSTIASLYGVMWLKPNNGSAINLASDNGALKYTSNNGVNVYWCFEGETTNTLSIRNGTNAQAIRLYNTYTSSTNKEHLTIAYESNIAKIYTAAGSSGGTTRALCIGGGSSVGTNIAGANTLIAGGAPTGNGIGGKIIFQTATGPGGSTTIGTLQNRWVIDENGLFYPSSIGQTIGITSNTLAGVFTQVVKNSVDTTISITIGTIIDFYGSELNIPTNYLTCNGDSHVGSTYPDLRDLFNTSMSGTITESSNVIADLSDTSHLQVGWTVYDSNFPDGTVISSIDNSTQITVSNYASNSSSGNIIFYFYGATYSTSSFNVPNVTNSSKIGYKIIRAL